MLIIFVDKTFPPLLRMSGNEKIHEMLKDNLKKKILNRILDKVQIQGTKITNINS